MSNIKFTPGKYDGRLWSADDNPNLRALIYLDVEETESGYITGWVHPDVAKLVKAAPEFLEAAYVALAELEAVEKEIGVPSRGAPMLRAAIEKATR